MHTASATSSRFPSFQQWSPMGILAGGIFVIDLLLPLGVATGVLYVAVVLLSLRHQNSQLPIWIAAGCSVLTIIGIVFSPVGGEFWKVLLNRGLVLFAIWTTTLMSRIQLQQANANQDNLLLTDRVFIASNDHISILGQDYRYRRVNPSYEKFHEKESQDMIGISVSELLGDEVFNQTVKPMLDKCFQGHEVHYEAWFTFADNQNHFMSVSYLPLGSANTDIQELVVIARDMTDWKKSEEALLMSEQRHRALVQSAPFCIHEIDLEGRILSMNPAGQKMIEISEESEIISRSYLELIEEKDYERVKEYFTQACQGEKIGFEFQVKKRGKSNYYVKSFTPVRDKVGHIMSVMGIAEDITERKLAEEEMFHNEQQLRTVLDAMTNFIGIGSADGIVMDCNKPPLDMAGLTREDVIGKYFFDTYWLNYSPKVQEQVRGIIQRVSQGEIVREDYQARMGENLIVTVDACFVPVKNTTGKVQKIVHSGIDVTDRRRAENALHKSENQYRDLYESAPLAYFSASFDGHITMVNGRASELLGYSEKELIGKQVLTLYAPTKDGYEKASTLQKKAQEGLSIQDEELEMVKKNGSILWVSLTVRLIFDESGKIVERRGMVQNISARKKIECELRASEYRFRSLVETAGSIIIGLSPDGWIVEWNREAERLYGQSREEVLGKNYLELFIPESDQLRILDDINKVIKGTPTRDFQNVIITSDENQRQISWNIDRLIDEENHPYGVICVGRDITEWEEAQSQIQKWATIYQHTQWGVSVGDQDSQILESVNKAYAQMHGYTIEELEGQPIKKLFAPEFRNQIPGMNQVMQEKGRHSYEAIRVRKDGTRFPALVSISAIKDTDGSMLYGVTNVIDITTLKQAEEALRKSEERLSMALEASGSGTWDWNVQTGEVIIGGEWLKSLGYQPEDLTPTVNSWKELIHPDDFAHAKKEMARHFAKETTVYESINRILHKNGEWRWNLDRGQVVEWTTDGKPIRMVGTDTDITVRMEAEEALRTSEQRFRAYFESGVVGMAITSPDNEWVEVNERMCEILGFSRQELTERILADLTHPDDLAADMTNFLQLLSGDIKFYSTEKRFIQKNGKIVNTNLYIHAIRNNVGTVKYLMTMLEDVTKQKQAQELLLKWAMIFQHTQWGVAVSKGESNIFEMVNEAYAHMHGYAIREMEDMSIAQVFSQEFRAQLPKIIKQIHRDGFLSFEAEHLRKDGSKFPSLVTVSAIKDLNGQVLYRVANVIDISNLKQAQDALRQSEERLELALQGADLGLWDWDISTNYVYFSPRWAEMLGYSLHELEPHVRTWERLIHLDDKPKVMDTLQAHFDGKTPFYEAEHQLQTKEGNWRWVLTQGKVVNRDQHGKPLRITGTHLDITESKLAAEVLRKSEERFRTYFESGLVGMAITALEKGWLEANDRLCTMLGYSREELRQKTWAELTHPDDLREDEIKFNKLLAGTLDSYYREKRFIRKDGSLIFTNLYVNAVRTISKQVEYVTTMIEDISERKQAEIQLKEYQDWITGMVNIANDAVIAIDESQRIILFNQGAENIFGYEATEILGQSLLQLLPQRFAERHQAHIHTFLESMEQARRMGERTEVYGRRKDGEEFPAEASISKLQSSNGTTLTVILRDITERRQTEALLLESEEKFRIMFEQAAVGVAQIDSKTGIFVKINQRFCRIMGYSREEMMRKTFQIITHQEDRQPGLENMKRLASGELESFSMEKRYYHKNGHIVWVNLTVSPMWHEGEDPSFHISVVEDITERKVLEKAIQKHNEELEITVEQRTARIQELEQRRMQIEKLAALAQIAAGVAHEINNPLASISQSLVLLKRAISPEHPHFRYMAKTEDCIERIAAITRQLYQLYRPSGPTPMPVNLRMCMETAVEIMQKRTLKDGIRIEVLSPSKPVIVQASQGELIQVLCNLLHNAIDASAPKGTITLRLAIESMNVSISVTDHGKGISPETVPHIFEPFFTTKQNKAEGGMGLGLSISYSLVESMNGALDFSPSLGQGSTFTITLPVT